MIQMKSHTYAGGSNTIAGRRASAVAIVIAALALAAATPSASRAADASNILNYDLSATYDANVSRAAAVADQKNAWIISEKISVGRRFQISPADRFSLTADFKNSNLDDFQTLNNISVGLSASLFHKFGVGPDVPWGSLFASAARLDYKNPLMDGAQYDLSAAAGKRINSWLGLSAAFGIQSRSAAHTAYSGNNYTTSVGANIALPRGFFFQFNYGKRRGDITAQCFMPFALSPPSVIDESFEDYAKPGYRNYAYRRVFETDMTATSLSYQLSSGSVIYAELGRYDSNWRNRKYAVDTYKIGVSRSLN